MTKILDVHSEATLDRMKHPVVLLELVRCGGSARQDGFAPLVHRDGSFAQRQPCAAPDRVVDHVFYGAAVGYFRFFFLLGGTRATEFAERRRWLKYRRSLSYFLASVSDGASS